MTVLPYLKRKLLESYQRRNGRASIFLEDGRVELWLSRWADGAWSTTRVEQEMEPGLQSAVSSTPIFLKRALAEQGMATPYLSLYLPDHLVDYRQWAISDAFAGRKRREYGIWKAGQTFSGGDGDWTAHLFNTESSVQYFRHHNSISELIRQLEEQALVAGVYPALHAFALATISTAPVCLLCLGFGRWWSHIAVVEGQLVFQRSHFEPDMESVFADGELPAHLTEFAGLVRHFGRNLAEGVRPMIKVSDGFIEAVPGLLGQDCVTASVKEETVYKQLHGI
ncbi:hypothetical protein ACG1BZ_07555 [Microbulbifer sp. CNSA002]|uniref:hypothetical protein n=1 Tax=unclassified Microbulbifer TaxID=2619833 RepID=UPI0039B611FC